MTKNEELIQRCFDTDVNDDEMKDLFFELSRKAGLRDTYRSLQLLQNRLRSIPSPGVPSSLDERITSLKNASVLRLLPNRSPLSQFLSKKISISLPAIAAAFLFVMIGSYFAAMSLFVHQPKTEYVYVVEMPAYVVQSSTQTIKNN